MEYPYAYIYKPFHHRMRERKLFSSLICMNYSSHFYGNDSIFPDSLSSSFIFCVHTAASFFSVFIPSCLPCSGSLLTLFFFVIWNIVLYRIIFHSLSLTFIPRYIQFFYYSAFCSVPLFESTVHTKRFSLHGFVIIYILPLTISSSHCRINVYGTQWRAEIAK